MRILGFELGDDPLALRQFRNMQEGDQSDYQVSLLVTLAFSAGLVLLARMVLVEQQPDGRLPLFLLAFLVALVGLTTILGLLNTGFYRQWMPWLEQPNVSLSNSILETLVAVLILTEALVILMLMAIDLGWVSLVPGVLADVDVDDDGITFVGAHQAILRLEEIYVWHLADAIPVLKVPDTLGWRLAGDLNTTGGWLVLAYKVLVILPLISLAKRLVSRRAASDSTSGNEPRSPE